MKFFYARFKLIFNLLRANGFYWIFLYIWERLLGSHSLYEKRIELEIQKQLPGFNTSFYNKKEWERYNWVDQGEEWTDSPAWKEAVVDEVMFKYIKPGHVVLEIGPGAGRWAVVLAPRVKKLVLVDVASKPIEICKTRLANTNNVSYFVTDGSSLPSIADNSIDRVWSFDVFVHISPDDTKKYLAEIKRILVKGGIALIHHPKEGGIHGGFRSAVTDETFYNFLNHLDLEIIEKIDAWGEQKEFNFSKYADTLTVFRKNNNKC